MKYRGYLYIFIGLVLLTVNRQESLWYVCIHAVLVTLF